MWEATQRIHQHKLLRGLSAGVLVARLAAQGTDVRRETLSRVLNGRQATSWELLEALAEVTGADLSDLIERRNSA